MVKVGNSAQPPPQSAWHEPHPPSPGPRAGEDHTGSPTQRWASQCRQRPACYMSLPGAPRNKDGPGACRWGRAAASPQVLNLHPRTLRSHRGAGAASRKGSALASCRPHPTARTSLDQSQLSRADPRPRSRPALCSPSFA